MRGARSKGRGVRGESIFSIMPKFVLYLFIFVAPTLLCAKNIEDVLTVFDTSSVWL